MKIPDYKIAIIGAGFAGLGMAITLKRAGIDDFIIFEKEKRVGGTWWVNQYPGCACDVESHLYSFSFEPNPEWATKFSGQREILSYLERCAEKYKLALHLRLSTEINELRWDEDSARWHIRDATGCSYIAQFVVSGTGGLSVPSYPEIPGLKSFAGKTFHSQCWDNAYDLAGKRVAVIGTGASAIQFIPRIQPQVSHLDIYQRTPPWIVPKPDRPMRATEKRRFRRRPLAQKALRGYYYWLREFTAIGFNYFRPMMRFGERMAKRHLKSQVKDPVLRSKLKPAYTMGCKRVLLSNDYYPAISQANVDLITDPIVEITPAGIRTADGRERIADAIIFGTGFNVANQVPAGMIFGRGGIDLKVAWAGGEAAYKGTTVCGFPNLFLLIGPNTGLGHNSIVFMIESQLAYVMDALRVMAARGHAALDVRRDAQESWNGQIQKRLAQTVWNTGGCRSWYLHPVSGRNFVIWPGFTWRFRLALRRFDTDAYQFMQTKPAMTKPLAEVQLSR